MNSLSSNPMDVPELRTAEESEGLPDPPEDSTSEKFSSVPPVPDRPITVQELGNMYAEWRMANESSSGTEEWMPNQTILVIPAPKRKFNWKVCCSLLVTCAIGSVIAFGFAYYIDNYTSYEITNGRSKVVKSEPLDEEFNAELERFGEKVHKQLHDSDRISNYIEESLRSHEETMKMLQGIREQHDAVDSNFMSASEYDRQRKEIEDKRSPAKYQDLKNEFREFFSRLQRNKTLPKS